VAEADDHGEFVRVAEAAVSEHAEFVDVERVRRLVEWAGITSEAFALAAQAVADDEAALGAFYVYPDEPQSIDPEETAALEGARAAGQLVYVHTDSDEFLGFVVAFSDDLVLIQNVFLATAAVNGYSAFARGEVLRIESLEDAQDLEGGEHHFLTAAAEVVGLEPVDPHAPLADLPTFLRWLGSTDSFVAIAEDRRAPEGRFIGRIAAVDGATVELRGVDVRAAPTEGTRVHAIGDITRVDFDDGYLRALALAARRG
jgi:hypothetical protein